MKRFFLFLMTNIAVIAVLSIVLKFSGAEAYIQSQFGFEYGSLLVFSFIFGMSGSFVSLLLSKYFAKKMMGVVVVNTVPEYKPLVDLVKQLANKSNIAMPEVGYYNSPEINAFATGPSRNNSLVAVSSGLLENMDNEEIHAVLAHEVGHIANGDMVTMTLLQGVLNTFVIFFSRILARFVMNALNSNDNRGGSFVYFAVVMLLQVVFGFLASIIVAAFSRYREYRADASGAQLAGKHAMIKALEKLKRDSDMAKAYPPEKGFSSFQISSFGGLFSTHPPLEKRIQALRES